jgi:hypothetical protein
VLKFEQKDSSSLVKLPYFYLVENLGYIQSVCPSQLSRVNSTRGSTRNPPISVILVNAIIFSVISLLREDPLPPGILDMFFLKYRIMCLFL